MALRPADTDVLDLLDAAAARVQRTRDLTPLEALCVELSFRHPLRWGRFMRDLRWLRSKARQKGIEL